MRFGAYEVTRGLSLVEGIRGGHYGDAHFLEFARLLAPWLDLTQCPLAPRAPIRGSHRLGVRLPLHAMPDVRPVGRRMSTVAALEPPRRLRFVTPIRLRHLLGLATLALGIQALVPRALAYWRLHGEATQFANYALCMVGPTGPVLLRDRPADFWRLARRRLVASPPEARPFAACVPALDAFADEAARRRGHQAKAQEFEEFATAQGSLRSPLSIDDLKVTSARLEELARAAWPFAGTSYAELVQPSRNARAAPHPVELAPPAEGHGLPTANLGYGAIRVMDGGYLLVAGRDANLSAYRSRDRWPDVVRGRNRERDGPRELRSMLRSWCGLGLSA